MTRGACLFIYWLTIQIFHSRLHNISVPFDFCIDMFSVFDTSSYMRVKQAQPAHKIHYHVGIYFTLFPPAVSCYEQEIHYVT